MKEPLRSFFFFSQDGRSWGPIGKLFGLVGSHIEPSLNFFELYMKASLNFFVLHRNLSVRIYYDLFCTLFLWISFHLLKLLTRPCFCRNQFKPFQYKLFGTNSNFSSKNYFFECLTNDVMSFLRDLFFGKFCTLYDCKYCLCCPVVKVLTVR